MNKPVININKQTLCRVREGYNDLTPNQKPTISKLVDAARAAAPKWQYHEINKEQYLLYPDGKKINMLDYINQELEKKSQLKTVLSLNFEDIKRFARYVRGKNSNISDQKVIDFFYFYLEKYILYANIYTGKSKLAIVDIDGDICDFYIRIPRIHDFMHNSHDNNFNNIMRSLKIVA